MHLTWIFLKRINNRLSKETFNFSKCKCAAYKVAWLMLKRPASTNLKIWLMKNKKYMVKSLNRYNLVCTQE